MVDLLPRNRELCTVQPIVLKLREDPDHDREQKLVLSIPDASAETAAEIEKEG